MSFSIENDLELEIAHVLLIDVVGYSKLLVDAQIDVLKRLNQIVRTSPRFVAAETNRKLTRLPTGDGMALIFFDSPEAPVQCALEISAAARAYPELQLRMGAHSGPIKAVSDVNDRANFAGSGINLAQRVLDCGDAGHILLSSRLADDLRAYRHWHPHLRDLGECAVKHGLTMRLFNLCKEDLGNPALPKRLSEERRAAARLQTAPRRRKLIASGMAAAVLLGGFVGWRVLHPPNIPAPEKSVAVLPFASLSDDKANAYFADGMQDEIITDLARLADLKVISRSSVMRYKPAPNLNARSIGRELGVAHILEGTVQRDGNRIRVNAQLIDTRTDAHVWAKSYDGELSDVFQIQSAIAEQIVAQLQRHLSAKEKAEFEAVPTSNPVAYERYVRAKSLIDGAVFSGRGTEDLTEAARLLNDAVSRDPGFYLAYYQLAHVHDQLFLRSEQNQAHLVAAQAAINSLQKLRPDSGEAHLAVAKHRYWGYRDYDRALQELALAEAKLPNEASALLLRGYIGRRRGDWKTSTLNFERAAALDPENSFILQQLSISYQNQRQFAAMAAVLDRASRLAPNDLALGAQRAAVELEARGNTEPLREFITQAVSTRPSSAGIIADQWLYVALCRRDYGSARDALQHLSDDGCQIEGVPFPRSWCEGVVARLSGDEARARTQFTQARIESQRMVAEQPGLAGAYSALAMAAAALNEHDAAIANGERAVQLLPADKDAVFAPVLVAHLALVYAWTGRTEAALERLSAATSVPSIVGYGNLKLHPYWDSLRGDPRFEQIVASLAPK